ncbi:MAG: hypothetical protein ACTHMS_13775 [Jatrophihabitans sp.]|uniref:hypothetical protein n=1 Tax=Jatrophihabitans sp. TaxID=1932789 RepID=UPI003F7F8BF0
MTFVKEPTRPAPRPTPQANGVHAGAPAPRVSNPAAARDNRYRTLQLVLFTGGAVLMPFGVILICVGWYGAAHTKYSYDQFPYLISGGCLGLGLAFVGGFLYFGAWLAKVANDQKESSRQIADTILVLADLVSRQQAGVASPELADAGAVPVLAGPAGTTVHRRDCALIAHRDDLRVLTGTESGLTTCRVCRPDVHL